MSTEEQVLPDESKTDETALEDLMARVTLMEADKENAKKNEAGLQRKVQEQETVIEALRTESMSAKDKATYEAEQSQRKADEMSMKLQARETALDKRDVMNELSIPAKFEGRIFGNTKEELRADATAFMAIYNSDIDDTASTRVNETLAHGKPPKSGEETKPINSNLNTKEDGFNATEEEFLAYATEVDSA